jgi:protein-disulfide isomerase
MARRTVETQITPTPSSLESESPVSRRTSWLTTPAALLLGSALISFAILLHGGIIKIKGVTPKTGSTGTTTTTTTTPTTTGETTEVAASPEEQMNKLVAFAGEQGWDEDAFRSCVTEQKYKAEFDKDNTDAANAGVSGTPGFVVGKSGASVEGVMIAGAYPYETFKAVFDALAANQTTDQIITARSADGLTKATASVDDDAVLGNANAPVTLIEFSDYECPFCQRHFKQVYPSIKKDYVDTGKVKVVFRDFVAVPGHNPNATTAAMAASCAKELGGDEGYYAMHDYYFTNTKANGQGI